MDIEKIVQDGLTLHYIQAFNATYDFLSRQTLPKEMIPSIKFVLNKIQSVIETRDINKIKTDDFKHFSYILSVLNNSMSDDYKITNSTNAISLPSKAIQQYFGLNDHNDVLTKGKISNIELIDSMGANIFSSINSEGELQKKLTLTKNINHGASAAISNIHEFYHSFQKEKEDILTTSLKITSNPLYEQLLIRLNENPNFHEDVKNACLNRHFCGYLFSDKIVSQARDIGIDIPQYKSELKKILPTLDYLSCFAEGDAVVNQLEIVKKIEMDDSDAIYYQDMYKVVSLLDTVLSPIASRRPKIFKVGIGIAEYIRAAPETREYLKKSSDFHEAISDFYFK